MLLLPSYKRVIAKLEHLGPRFYPEVVHCIDFHTVAKPLSSPGLHFLRKRKAEFVVIAPLLLSCLLFYQDQS